MPLGLATNPETSEESETDPTGIERKIRRTRTRREVTNYRHVRFVYKDADRFE